jgi:hypothetical protein
LNLNIKNGKIILESGHILIKKFKIFFKPKIKF